MQKSQQEIYSSLPYVSKIVLRKNKYISETLPVSFFWDENKMALIFDCQQNIFLLHTETV